MIFIRSKNNINIKEKCLHMLQFVGKFYYKVQVDIAASMAHIRLVNKFYIAISMARIRLVDKFYITASMARI